MDENKSYSDNFLQSEEWRKFQEKAGHRTFHVENENFLASIIEHKLPIVGNYFYIPKGPLFCHSGLPACGQVGIQDSEILKRVQDDMEGIIKLARKEKAGWIRIDPENEKILEIVKSDKNYKLSKAPHDMQPREIFVIDITRSVEDTLAEMKSKTRYNIKLAKKRGVEVRSASSDQGLMINEYVDEFIKLIRITSKRDRITSHPEDYYRKMLEIPFLKLYVAEYEGKIISAGIFSFFGKTATYMHGASSNEYRNVMAPHLLQWQVILDAKEKGCEKYDFGGIATNYKLQATSYNKSWKGITRFKLSFSPSTEPMRYPGSYDIVLSTQKYLLYRLLQKLKSLVR